MYIEGALMGKSRNIALMFIFLHFLFIYIVSLHGHTQVWELMGHFCSMILTMTSAMSIIRHVYIDTNNDGHFEQVCIRFDK